MSREWDGNLETPHRCPCCGHVDRLDQFQVGGTDEGNIMCPKCDIEHEPLLASEPIGMFEGHGKFIPPLADHDGDFNEDW